MKDQKKGKPAQVQEKRDPMFPPAASFSEKAHVKSLKEYEAMFKRSLEDMDGFWAEQAEKFQWNRKWDKVVGYNYDMRKGPIRIEWFQGAKTNVSVNCLDRHLKTKGGQTAILWEGNEPTEDRKYTYKELHEQVCRFANVLKSKGVKKGDRVSIYLPMIPELAIAMLGCVRIGAVHSVVFGGFSAESLADRILDSKCAFLVTADGTYRGPKAVTLKSAADEAMKKASANGMDVKTCIVVERVGAAKGIKADMKPGRDVWWHDEMKKASPACEPEVMDAEDPLFILYTSGSTGKPKGQQHTCGGYMVFVGLTHKLIFDYHDGEVFWCTADIGWITGHSYIVYGPLLNGAISLMFEGVPMHPEPDRFWRVVEKHKVNIFYTAPTAIRSIAAKGTDFPARCNLSSLRLLGSVGEPINPEAWMWYHKHIGKEKCPIVDTWWQTETGGILITPLPGAWATKPGSATFPFFGVEPAILDDKGNELKGEASGVLAIKRPWPGQSRTIYGDHQRFEKTYFEMYPGYYFTGDGASRDKDGYYWITGRVDDVLKVSGHRLGTATIESALVSHPKVAEAAVVGFPHEIKGQGIYAYVTLKVGAAYTDDLRQELVGHVRKEIGPIATPDVIHWAPELPKTRSGKIMRRILRKIAEGQFDQIGDTTTLADPAVVESLIKSKGK